jgi:hypothetical protein
VTPVAGGYAVEFPETTAPDPFMYRIRCERKVMSENGRAGRPRPADAWEAFTQDDIFSEFWKAKADRTGTARHVLATGFFTPGVAYRVTVAPLDWFYRASRAIAATFTATHTAETAWTLDDPMHALRFTEYGKPVELSVGGRFVPPSGQGTLWLPDGALAKLKPGVRHQLVVDLDAVQPDGEWCAWRVTLRGRNGAKLCDVQTVPGAPGPLRYVFAFTVPAGGLDSAELVFNYASPGASLRIDRCRIVTANL